MATPFAGLTVLLVLDWALARLDWPTIVRAGVWAIAAPVVLAGSIILLTRSATAGSQHPK